MFLRLAQRCFLFFDCLDKLIVCPPDFPVLFLEFVPLCLAALNIRTTLQSVNVQESFQQTTPATYLTR